MSGPLVDDRQDSVLTQPGLASFERDAAMVRPNQIAVFMPAEFAIMHHPDA